MKYMYEKKRKRRKESKEGKILRVLINVLLERRLEDV